MFSAIPIEESIVKINCNGRHGTGFLVAPDAIITCKHLAYEGSENGLTIKTEPGEVLKVSKILTSSIDDISLIMLSEKTKIGIHTIFLNDLPWQRLGKLNLNAKGYGGIGGTIKKMPSLKIQGMVLDEKGNLDNMQFGTGAVEGMSGGPVYIESGNMAYIVGMLYLGGEKAPTSRMIAADTLSAFLKERGIKPDEIPFRILYKRMTLL
jgi:hypothetical protein